MTEILTGVDMSTVDLFDMRLWADGPPHELFAQLRAQRPVHANPLPDGSHCWALTKHADIKAVSRDPGTFSSARGGVFLHPDQMLPLEVLSNLLLYMDPPDHTPLRQILQRVFTPRAVAGLERQVRSRVTRTIDGFIENGSCDFVDEFAVPIPLGVLAELMGIPEVDIHHLHTWTEELEQTTRDAEPNTAGEAFGKMSAYLHAQIERQTAEAVADSLVVRLRSAVVDGQKLADLEILTFLGLLAFAGNDTTRNTMSTGMLALLEHPDTLEQLRADPKLIPGAVEEILRWTTVIQWFKRTATQDTEIGDARIKAGDRVIQWYGSASRDEDVFADADRFDIRRDQSEHMAFGGGGRHFCLGASLARLELRVMLEEIVDRLWDLEPAGDVERLASNWAHGLVHMPVTFQPGCRRLA